VTFESTLALILDCAFTTERNMSACLKKILAVWFVTQIVLPFTAPLQTCELRDLFGTPPKHHTPVSHESSTIPTATESNSEANSFVSALAASALHASTSLAIARHVIIGRALTSTFGLSPSPQVQTAVLRL